jgi:long-chain acyl-CoA synthetase
MIHPLDIALDSVRSHILQQEGPFKAGTLHLPGGDYPAFVGAPPHLSAFFALSAHLYGERIALVDGETRLSFGALYALAGDVARGLVSRHGIKPGDRVAIAGRNGAGWILAYMGTLMAGGTAALVNAFWTGTEMAAAINSTGCTLVLADKRRHAALHGCDATLGAHIVTLDLDAPLNECLAPLISTDDVVLPAITADMPATILYTSGSTGTSKGALSCHRAKVQGALNYSCATLCMATVLTQQGRPPNPLPATLLNLPLFHVTAEVAVFLNSLAIGRKMVIMPRWDALEAMRLIEAETITYFVGVPLMGDEIATHPRRGEFDLSSLTDVAAGGAPRPAEHVARIPAGLNGASPVLGYGLTETNAVGCGAFRDSYLDRPTSTGRPTAPIVDLRLIDDAGNDVPDGEIGEIAIRSVANIEGYLNRPEDTAALFTASGHLRTGDLARMDEDGYIFIVDRKKDIIIRGGENIACGEVEAALYAVPDVLECAVFGVPDERLGEVPVALVHLRAGSALDAASLTEAIAPTLAPYKRPSPIVIRPEPLPRLGTEKIDKRACKALFAAG